MPSIRRWLPKAVFESLLIVFSILLALGAGEWQKARERDARVAVAIEGVRTEIAANLAEIRESEAYHSALADTLFALSRAGVSAVGPERYPRGVILSPTVVGTAWSSAQATGTAADLPYEVAMSIALVYERQARYERRSEDLLLTLYDHLLRTGGTDFLHREYGVLAGALSDLAGWERELIAAYEAALERLPASDAPLER